MTAIYQHTAQADSLHWLTKPGVFIGLLILFLCSSCETVVEIELPIEEPRLVVNSIFNADSVLTVNVTSSRPTSEPGYDFETVDNAIVEVFKDQQSLGLLSYAGKGNYRSVRNLLAEANSEFKLVVKAGDFKTAEARELVPVRPVVSSLEMHPLSDGSYKPRFTLHDSMKDDFYFLRAWIIYENGTKNSISYELKTVLGQFHSHAGFATVYFDDRFFNGKEIKLDLEIFRLYPGDNKTYKVLFELASINKSYYDYQYSVVRKFGDIPLLDTKNVIISNNIKNGLGIFAPYNSAALYYDVK